MLGLSLKRGSCISIGNTVIRMMRSHNGIMRLAIDAPDDARIFRFDAAGELLTSRCRSVKRIVETEMRGEMEFSGVIMNCGHYQTIKTTEMASPGLECQGCNELIESIRLRVKTLVTNTAKETSTAGDAAG